MPELSDSFNRRLNYLRISVTDRCNLRCLYCMPEQGIRYKPYYEIISFEEIHRIVKILSFLGINKIRLTGGEPLIRKDIVNLVRLLSAIDDIEDISMTTNAVLLKKYASDLKAAGLRRLNISLDSLDEQRYSSICRGANLKDALQGLEEAQRLGFSPIKINVVLLEDLGDEEIRRFLLLSKTNYLHIRFLELMPMNNEFGLKFKFVSADKIMDICLSLGEIEPIDLIGSGPSKNFRFRNSKGSFGIIMPMSNKFCLSCNRLRLTADGFLKLCLHSDIGVNLREALRKDIPEQEIIGLIQDTVNRKPKGHNLEDKTTTRISEYSMCQIGG